MIKKYKINEMSLFRYIIKNKYKSNKNIIFIQISLQILTNKK